MYQHWEYLNRTRIKCNCPILKDQFIKSTALLPVKTQSACLWLFKIATEHFFRMLRQAKAIFTLAGLKYIWDVLFIRHFFQPHLQMLVAVEVGVYGSMFLGSWGWWFFLCLCFTINRRLRSPRCNASSLRISFARLIKGKSEDLIRLYTFIFFKLFNFYYCCTIYTITYNFNASIVHFVFFICFPMSVCWCLWHRMEEKLELQWTQTFSFPLTNKQNYRCTQPRTCINSSWEI